MGRVLFWAALYTPASNALVLDFVRNTNHRGSTEAGKVAMVIL